MSFLSKRLEVIRPLDDKISQLGLQVSSLEGQITSKTKEYKEIVANIESGRKKFNQFDEEIGELVGLFTDISEFIRGAITENGKILNSASGLLTEYLVEIKKAENRLIEAISQVDRARGNYKQIHAGIMSEQEEINKQKRDLDIYHERLEKLRHDVGSEEKIIL